MVHTRNTFLTKGFVTMCLIQCLASGSMPVISVRLVLVAICLGLGGSSAISTEKAGKTGNVWKAGISRAIITPDKDVWLAGYGTKRSPDGKLHDIWMKSLALEDVSGNRAVLITSDFMGVPKSMSDRVFDHLQRRFGLERKQVMITFSHNHCGPRLEGDLIDYYPVDTGQEKLVAEYTRQMVERMVSLVGESLERLTPAILAVGEGTATFAVNRRNNPEAKIPELLAAGMPLVGPVDHSVPVLQVMRLDGSIAAILFGYACHPTTLNFMTWCGDFPGFAQLEIESMHPGAIAMYVNTCGGDQNPLPRQSVELCQKYGHMLAVGVEEALRRPPKTVASTLQVAYKVIDLEYESVVGKHDLEAAATDSNPIKARWANRMLEKLKAGETFQSSYPYPLHAWRLGGETILIGMGGETLVDYALAFKRTWGPETWVLGYTDDMIAYIPSRRVWEEGGYEGTGIWECGHPAIRWAGDIEDRIVKAVTDLVEVVRHPVPENAATVEDSACWVDTKTIVPVPASTLSSCFPPRSPSLILLSPSEVRSQENKGVISNEKETVFERRTCSGSPAGSLRGKRGGCSWSGGHQLGKADLCPQTQHR
jgi:neutral ceramidase